jgi:hypothetical protein
MVLTQSCRTCVSLYANLCNESRAGLEEYMKCSSKFPALIVRFERNSAVVLYNNLWVDLLPSSAPSDARRVSILLPLVGSVNVNVFPQVIAHGRQGPRTTSSFPTRNQHTLDSLGFIWQVFTLIFYSN